MNNKELRTKLTEYLLRVHGYVPDFALSSIASNNMTREFTSEDAYAKGKADGIEEFINIAASFQMMAGRGGHLTSEQEAVNIVTEQIIQTARNTLIFQAARNTLKV